MANRVADPYERFKHLLRPAARRVVAAAKKPFAKRMKALDQRSSVTNPQKTFAELVATAQPIPARRKTPALTAAQLANLVHLERDRCKAIVRYGMEKGLVNQAASLAFKSDLDVEEAIRLMDVTAQIKAQGLDITRRR